MKNYSSFKIGLSFSALICLTLMTFGTIFSSSPVVFASSNPPYSAQGFNVLTTAWGTPANLGQAGPGDTDVPLTVTLQYVYSAGSAVSVSGILVTARTGFSSANGNANSTAYYSSALSSGGIFELTFYLNLNSTLKVGNHYVVPLTLDWSAILSNSTNAPETYLTQTTSVSVPVEGDAKLSFTTSQTYLTAGDVNNLNFTVFNDGSGYAANILTSLTSQLAGIQSTVPKIQNLTAGSNATFPLQIYVPGSSSSNLIPLDVSVQYENPYGTNASVSQVIELHSTAASEPRLVFSPKKATLIPGQINNITVTISNLGSGMVSDITTTTTGSGQGISIIQDLPTISNLSPGASQSASLSVYVPSSSAGQAVTLTFSATYIDPYGNSGSSSQEAGFQIASSSGISTSTFSVTAISNSVISGSMSKVSFQIKNLGNATIYSPVYSVAVSQPLVIAENSSYAASGTSISPGESQTFTTLLTASPGSSAGTYAATLQISFTDRYGSEYNQSYSLAILLSGSIILVDQNVAYSQNASGITVTGNLLDEGSSSAYYASVTGYLNGSKIGGAPNYVGDIDPNTPVPFTVTIPYQAQSHSAIGNITLAVQFMNSLGQNLNSSSSGTTQLKSASELFSLDSPSPSNSGSSSGLSILDLTIILIVVLVAAGGGSVAVVQRRQRRKVIPSNRSGNKPGTVA